MPGLTCAWILAPSRWRPSFTNLTVTIIISYQMILIKDVVLFRAPSGPRGEACQRHLHGQERAAGRLPCRDGAARRLPDPQRLQLQVSTSSQIFFNFSKNIFSFHANIFLASIQIFFAGPTTWCRSSWVARWRAWWWWCWWPTWWAGPAPGRGATRACRHTEHSEHQTPSVTEKIALLSYYLLITWDFHVALKMFRCRLSWSDLLIVFFWFGDMY